MLQLKNYSRAAEMAADIVVASLKREGWAVVFSGSGTVRIDRRLERHGETVEFRLSSEMPRRDSFTIEMVEHGNCARDAGVWQQLRHVESLWALGVRSMVFEAVGRD